MAPPPSTVTDRLSQFLTLLLGSRRGLSGAGAAPEGETAATQARQVEELQAKSSGRLRTGKRNRRAGKAAFLACDPVASWRAMLLIRRFEEKAGQMFAMGLIGGFCHLCIGQEAIAVGMRQAARPGDQFIASYRMHGHLLASGADPRAMMAELIGSRDGLSHGKGGSMHMFAPELGFFGGNGIVAAQASIGTGIAFANAYVGNGKVCVAFLGDGAADQGQLAESLRDGSALEPAHRLRDREQPAECGTGPRGAGGARRGVPDSRRTGGRHVPDLGARRRRAGAGMGARRQWPPGSGNAHRTLPRPLRRGARQIPRARRGDAPPGEPAQATAAQATPAQAPDPIARLRARILEEGLAAEADLRRIDQEIRVTVADAADQAARGEAPGAADLMTDILLEAAP